jgi:protein-tyrosine phosphatase
VTYVDLHCHLLAGLDDGSPSMAESLRYARRLDQENVLDVACTPHVKRSAYPRLRVAELASRRADLQAAIAAEGLRVRLHQGGELAHEDALERPEEDFTHIAQGPAHAPWLLLECPFEGLDESFDEAVARLSDLGYGLLLAHPERAAGSLEPLRPHLEAGALLQINVSSLRGDHGQRARSLANGLVRDGFAFCLASDNHPGTRETMLPQGPQVLQELGISDVQIERLTQANPRFLLREGVAAPQRVATWSTGASS